MIELLVVVALIGLLLGLILSAVQNVRGSAVRVGCQNRLRQVALATQNFYSSHDHFPTNYRLITRSHGITGPIPWSVDLLPHLEHEALFRSTLEAYSQEAWGFQAPPHIGLTSVVTSYTCPADSRLNSPITDADGFTAAYCSFLGVAGVEPDPVNGDIPPTPLERIGVFSGSRPVRGADVSDGLSQTVMYGERPPPGRRLVGVWYTVDVPSAYAYIDDYHRGLSMNAFRASNTNTCRGPFKLGPGRLDNVCDSHHFWSLHGGGANFAFADGSVRFLTYAANSILPALATRAGGEVVAVP